MNGASRDGATSGAELLAQEARRSRDELPDVQYGHTDGVIDLTWGHPDPSTFPRDEIAEASGDVLNRRGWQALSYGAPAGAAAVRSAVAAHLTDVDADVSPHAVLITAGSTGALDLVLSLLATRGDVVFVEQPTYFIALRIFADHGLRVVALRGDAGGPDPDELARRAAATTATGAKAFLYLVPTYANPTGKCLPRQRAEALLAAAATGGARVIEDDVYRDTSPDPPASMWSIDPSAVIRLGSFSKSLAPGLRVGFLTATPDLVDRIAGCGVLDSGGGTNHFAAMVVGELIRSGCFGEIVRANVPRYRACRRALVDELDPTAFAYDEPAGGFFVWLRLPENVASHTFVAAARDNGVLVSDGRAFFAEVPDAGYVRVSFSMLDQILLRDGARRLVRTAVELSGPGR
jgi:DNA-binding transcriptional MocR family regulator